MRNWHYNMIIQYIHVLYTLRAMSFTKQSFLSHLVGAQALIIIRFVAHFTSKELKQINLILSPSFYSHNNPAREDRP